MRWALLLAVGALAACGDERPQSVEVTEAEDGPLPIRRSPQTPPAAFDTTYADTAYAAALRADSLARADSLRADSLRADSLRQDARARAAARPDFRTFWPQFRAAVAEGPEAVAARTAFSDALSREAFDAVLFAAAFAEGPFRDGALALTPRDFRRDGTRRDVSVTVGYDAEGAVVPEDEAVTESSVLLTFDVVDGAYRLVWIDVAG